MVDFNTWALVGIGIVLVVFIDFINRLGKGIPLLELMLLVAGLQWIIGPIIEYNFPANHFKYYMYVEESIYMGYVVPAYIMFVAGVFLAVRKNRSVDIPVDKIKDYKKYGVSILIIGIFFDLISNSLPGFIGFFAFLLGNFKFAGAIILFFAEDKKLKVVFYLAVVLLFIRALGNAMFHDFILWSTFLYMFWAIKHKPSKIQISVTILIAIFGLFTLQTIKTVYREQIWEGYDGSNIELFTSLFMDALFKSDTNTSIDGNNSVYLTTSENNIRLNQGWIISAIMDQVPLTVPFQNGKTIEEAFFATLLPRIIDTDKKEAGGRENFILLTGLGLSEGTSMGISIVGEGYANFGVFGGILFMGVWGWFLGWYWVKLLKIMLNKPLLLTFLPLIYLQVVKAETEISVVLNHMIKATVVVFLFFWAAKAVFGWNIKKKQTASV